ncbi:MAG: hypothetical protein A2Z20_03460 [Bdellovibrionales bacterium RBG_16_40_8]|nr:MAG: hypothetical protein A2Z20_03460 [Bdellovibrionales bacterium RBG_16_40_8]
MYGMMFEGASDNLDLSGSIRAYSSLTTFHEFLHFAQIDNLSSYKHNSDHSDKEKLQDTVYSCSGYAFQFQNGDIEKQFGLVMAKLAKQIRFNMCMSCALTRSKNKPKFFHKTEFNLGIIPNAHLLTDDKSVKLAEAVCSEN